MVENFFQQFASYVNIYLINMDRVKFAICQINNNLLSVAKKQWHKTRRTERKKSTRLNFKFRLIALSHQCVLYGYLNLPVYEQIDHGYGANVLYIVCAMH